MTKELELAIKADVLAGRMMTYAKAGALLGHKIPECVFKLIVRDRVVVQ